jgi:hypothetical protein
MPVALDFLLLAGGPQLAPRHVARGVVGLEGVDVAPQMLGGPLDARQRGIQFRQQDHRA